MKRIILLCSIGIGVFAFQQPDFSGRIGKQAGKPTIAVPDFRGAGDAGRFMTVFNTTLYNELNDSGQLKIVPKTSYPLNVPQQPSDFHQPPRWLSDWSSPPVNSNSLAFGYTGSQNNQI